MMISAASAKSHIKKAVWRSPLRVWVYPEPRFVITGTGRSGTRYVATLLTEAGIKTGHEQWWNPLGQKASRLVGDASWCAAFCIESYGGQVFHQVRDTIKVIQSMVAVEVAPHRIDKIWPQYRRRWVEYTGDPIVDAMTIVDAWLTQSELRAEWTWRVEDLDEDLVLQLADRIGMRMRESRVAGAFGSSAIVTNTKADKRAQGVKIGWDDLPVNATKDRLLRFAEGFGYA